jgi:hypothetical protein
MNGTLYGPCPRCRQHWTPRGKLCRYCQAAEKRGAA